MNWMKKQPFGVGRFKIEYWRQSNDVIHVGLLCVQAKPSLWPSIARVVVAMVKSEVKFENWEDVKVSKTFYSNQ